MKSILIFTVILLSQRSISEECLKYPWTKEKSRSQGGGWVWFPGRGEAESKEDAILRAEGSALLSLIKECEIVPKETKFHETCYENSEIGFQAYVRASIKEKDCNFATITGKKEPSKYGNKVLQARLEEYQTFLKQEELSKIDGCNQSDPTQCADLAQVEIASSNKSKAEFLLRVGCRNSNLQSCLSLAKLNLDGKKLANVNSLIELSCKYENIEDCYNYAEKFNNNKHDEIAYFINKRICELGHVKGCFQLANYYKFSSKVREAVYAFGKACKMKSGVACLELSKMIPTDALKYLKLGCDYESADSCLKLSEAYTEKKDLSRKRSAYKKYCDLSKKCSKKKLFDLMDTSEDEEKTIKQLEI